MVSEENVITAAHIVRYVLVLSALIASTYLIVVEVYIHRLPLEDAVPTIALAVTLASLCIAGAMFLGSEIESRLDALAEQVANYVKACGRASVEEISRAMNLGSTSFVLSLVARARRRGYTGITITRMGNEIVVEYIAKPYIPPPPTPLAHEISAEVSTRGEAPIELEHAKQSVERLLVEETRLSTSMPMYVAPSRGDEKSQNAEEETGLFDERREDMDREDDKATHSEGH